MRGVPIVLLAAILILVGLLPALYTSRTEGVGARRTERGGSLLKVGGFALQRKAQFEEEFAPARRGARPRRGAPGRARDRTETRRRWATR